MSEGKVIQGDCLEVLREMEDNSVDAVVCDPPYGLSNTNPELIADTIAKWVGGDRGHVPAGRGFMGKSWDAFVPPPAVWDECLRVLKPGGHMVVFAGSRTQDLMGLSIRLAGFEIRDSVAWLYGSGFPKSHNVGKSTGDERYAGHGTALKPGHEPIVLARKPLAEKTVARNVLAHGTGAINIDGCRIKGEPIEIHARTGNMTGANSMAGVSTGSTGTGEFRTDGRWPANVLLDQHAAAWVDEQSGITRSNVRPPTGKDDRGKANTASSMTVRRNDTTTRGVSDQGGASRFFTTIERSNTPCATTSENATTTTATTADSAKPALSGTGSSARDAGVNGDSTDVFLYTAKAPKSERPNVDGVQHPTVKPLAIMRWLIRLVTPPGGTVLDPFAGSGTTIEAALIEGFNPVGIEMETDYLPLIQHRIDRQAGARTA